MLLVGVLTVLQNEAFYRTEIFGTFFFGDFAFSKREFPWS